MKLSNYQVVNISFTLTVLNRGYETITLALNVVHPLKMKMKTPKISEFNRTSSVSIILSKIEYNYYYYELVNKKNK